LRETVPVIPFGDVFLIQEQISRAKRSNWGKIRVTVEGPQGTLQVRVAVAQGGVAEDNIIVALPR
jgi:hypothetical protein